MSQTPFTPEQRWISDSEPELGLGRVVKVAGRTVDLRFDASNEGRRYATDNAPLTRVAFQGGDRISSIRGQNMIVGSTIESGGLLTYLGTTIEGDEHSMPEQELDPFTQFNRPQVKLFNGQTDDNRWFQLRRTTLNIRQQLAASDLIGLGGARTELLPHQLYIAHEVGHTLAPRVLLADEVGLGKTIEAGLILHSQLLTGRASRVLVIVPPPLLHQWLIELMRRFNLNFSLFDEQRCQAIEASDPGSNPFLSEQLVLCGIDMLSTATTRLQQACEAEWDLMVVDEAHHLEWHPDQPSTAYTAVSRLTEQTPGVLLLTATPEQQGEDGHFARLRLLDPDRYPDFEQFHREQATYQKIADTTRLLLSEAELPETIKGALLSLGDDPQIRQQLDAALSEQDQPLQRQARDQLISLLLDRYGTGRAMYRNTRDRVKGFSVRRSHRYALPMPDAYRSQLSSPDLSPRDRLYPERITPGAPKEEWWRQDPRIDWLIDLLLKLRPDKVLLICAHAATAQDINNALRIREGITSGLFHEGLSLIERDRAAAWFADPEGGCQILICSEIGSEGRNFQFAHHLVLFDLPGEPDLLEQRIGRLDRIGQSSPVDLHIPYFADGAQAVLLDWYHNGLNALEEICQTGAQVLETLRPALHEALETGPEDPQATKQLLQATQELHRTVKQRLSRGRDHLLELNSCRPEHAERLLERINNADYGIELPTYMEQLFDVYGIDTEPHNAESLIIKPGQAMLSEQFPHLPESGTTATYHRACALAHEDFQFLTWEHPMVRDGMELILEYGRGNCAAGGVHHPRITSGTLALEMNFLLECPAPKLLQAGRFLPPTLIPLMVDQKLSVERPDSEDLDQISAAVRPLPKAVVQKIVTPLRGRIQAMLSVGETTAAQHAAAILDQAKRSMQQHYTEEQQRLTALSRNNPNIRPRDIERLRRQQEQLAHHMESSHVRLDSIRLLIGL